MMKWINLLFLCHRLPERSFFYRGRQFPLCARCTGIFLGYILAILFLLFVEPMPLFFAAVFLIPLIIDGGFQYLKYWKSTNFRRLMTGIWAGFGTIFIFYGIVKLGLEHGKMMAYYLMHWH